MHFVVDGMNVIGTRPDGWWRDRDAAMARLVDELERFSAASGDDVTVVFERAPRPPLRSTVIEIAHAPRPRPDAADYKILEIVKAHPTPERLHVVTSDHWLADAARDAGAVVEPSEGFRSRLEE
ncbi:MAG: RNA-binding protein [Solirubrobacterales bacterium]|nr:RNA-binding protein [Solirubrobacterales bacterium]